MPWFRCGRCASDDVSENMLAKQVGQNTENNTKNYIDDSDEDRNTKTKNGSFFLSPCKVPRFSSHLHNSKKVSFIKSPSPPPESSDGSGFDDALRNTMKTLQTSPETQKGIIDCFSPVRRRNFVDEIDKGIDQNFVDIIEPELKSPLHCYFAVKPSNSIRFKSYGAKCNFDDDSSSDEDVEIPHSNYDAQSSPSSLSIKTKNNILKKHDSIILKSLVDENENIRGDPTQQREENGMSIILQSLADGNGYQPVGVDNTTKNNTIENTENTENNENTENTENTLQSYDIAILKRHRSCELSKSVFARYGTGNFKEVHNTYHNSGRLSLPGVSKFRTSKTSNKSGPTQPLGEKDTNTNSVSFQEKNTNKNSVSFQLPSDNNNNNNNNNNKNNENIDEDIELDICPELLANINR